MAGGTSPAAPSHLRCRVRILWFSNAPYMGTGYGMQTADVALRLKGDGHEVAIACNAGLYGSAIEWNGLPLFPGGLDAYSNDIVAAHAQVWKADWTITLYDAWPLKRDMFPERVASWVPIDHQPVPPHVAAWCKQVEPIAMSRFGQRMLRDQGIESTYIPHAIDTGVFKPSPTTRNGRRPREAMDIPADAFLIMIAAANKGVHPPRKAWGQMYSALSRFMAEHPDAWLYVHTDKMGIGGVDLAVLEKATGLPMERVRYTDPYSYAAGRVGPEDLAALYTAADVLLASSMGEGFGIPVVEAQACGTPVIVSDFSAQPELCGAGWLVSGQFYWDEAQLAWMFDPYSQSIVARLADAYAARGDRALREQAIEFAAGYDSARIFKQHWRPFLAELTAKLEQPPTPNRAERRRRAKAKERAA